MRTAASLVVMVGLAILPVVAAAQNFEEAGKHFTAAQEAFGRRHYKVAAAGFQRAYDIAKDPVLLYNIGESWENAGDGKKAVAAFKGYLKAAPKAQDKASVAKRIKAIQHKHFKLANRSAPGDEEKAVVALGPPPTPSVTLPPPLPRPLPPPPVAEPANKTLAPAFLDEPSPPPPPGPALPPGQTTAELPPPAPASSDGGTSGVAVGAWVCAAITVVAVAGGVIFGLSARTRSDEITRREAAVEPSGQPKPFDAQQQADFKKLSDDGHLYNQLAIGLFAGAGAAAVLTVVLFAVNAGRHHTVERATALRVTPLAGRSAAGLGLTWAF